MLRCPSSGPGSRISLATFNTLVVATLAVAACGDDTTGTGGTGNGGDATTGTASGPGATTASSSPAGQGGAGNGGDATTTASQSPSSSNTTSAADGGGGTTAEGDAPTETVDFAASSETFENPERGFYSYVDLLDESDFDWVHERGHTLVYSYVHLDDYRGDDELPGDLLDDLDAAFATLREGGLKVVLRFAYNDGPKGAQDAPLDRVLGHIDQLTPTLQANADVIAVLQGGFVGAWGEWHASTNDLAEPEAREAIVEALLASVPPSRSVLMRYPPYKEALYGTPLEASEAWSGSDESRLGHHNDCFLSSETDVGTYPSDEVEEWKQYIEEDTRFVPNGGETCDPFPPRSECESALAEMARLHYTFMNQDYHPDIVESWVDDGCKDEMDQRLGYRLVLESAELPPALRPGGSFALHLRIRNEGFAAPMNPRELRIVIGAGGNGHVVALPGIDARMLMPGETTDVAARIRVPSSLAEGEASFALWMPDADLEDDERQSIRLANDGTWNVASGANDLGTISIAADAPGTSSDVEALEATPL